MAKLYFRYGSMNCGKSTALLQVAHNYEEKNKKVEIVKPIVDTKGEDKVVSRIGAERKVDKLIDKKDNLYEFYQNKNLDCILVDEAQFLEKKQVEELLYITKLLDIPVICYGLRTDFKTNGFPGSIRLLELADELDELITICSCGKKARFNARKIKDKYIVDGDQILIDTNKNIKYEPICGECYIKKVLKMKKVIK